MRNVVNAHDKHRSRRLRESTSAGHRETRLIDRERERERERARESMREEDCVSVPGIVASALFRAQCPQLPEPAAFFLGNAI